MFLRIGIFFLVFSMLVGGASADGKQVVIAFTNDIESAYDPVDAFWRDDIEQIGGIAQLATLIRKLRSQSQVFFLFDAGDIFTATLAKRTQGAVSFDLMALLAYDAIAIGNHEFEYGWQTLAEQKNRVSFPVLGANLFYKDTNHPFAQPWVILEREGIRIGVIGVMGQDAATALIPSNIAGLTVLPPVEVVPALVRKLRPECDLIVVLTHQGETAPMQTDDEADASVQRGNEANLELAGSVVGIDLILGGHTDAGTREALIQPLTGTAVMQTYGQGQHLGVAEFTVSDKAVDFEGGRLITVNADELAADPEIAARLEAYRALHADLYEPVGTLETGITRRYNAESSMGSLFADIVRDAAEADIGLMPSGALRKDIGDGVVTRVDLLDAFPFEDKIAIVTLRGSVLRAVLEQGLTLERGMLQVSGLSVRYDSSRPAGDRVLEVFVDNKPLDDEALYRVGTLEILAQGGDRYIQFLSAESTSWAKGTFADALLNAFEGEKDLRVGIEKRLTDVANP